MSERDEKLREIVRQIFVVRHNITEAQTQLEEIGERTKEIYAQATEELDRCGTNQI